MKAAKRSPAYRNARRSLLSVRPCEVWEDYQRALYFILFPAGEDGPNENYLGFAVAMGSNDVSASGMLQYEASEAGWTFRNLGSDLTL